MSIKSRIGFLSVNAPNFEFQLCLHSVRPQKKKKCIATTTIGEQNENQTNDEVDNCIVLRNMFGLSISISLCSRLYWAVNSSV